MPIPVFRVEKNANYTTMSNYHLRDNTISFKAKGLLSMFLSLPKDWSYSVKGIATISKEGVDGILSGLKELEAAGYLERHRMRNDKGRLGDSEYVIYEMPHRIRGSPELEKPNQEKPVQANPVQVTPEQEKPVEENPAQLNIEVINKDKQKQFQILQKLMNRSDVDRLICATDAGREGELIFRLVYHQCQCTKPFDRLWISSMEDSAIREGFQNLKPSSQCDSLYHAALCRERADWIIGINATRLFSCLYGQPLSIGRVMTPTLGMAVQREAAIAAFSPEQFYTVRLNANGINLDSQRFPTREDAGAILSACKNAEYAMIHSVTRKEHAEKPPALYDLTTLQRDANRLLGFTAQQALDYTQSLYEKKLVTYPRTDSRYLTEDMEPTLAQLVPQVAALLHVSGEVPLRPEQVMNNHKVTDHHENKNWAAFGLRRKHRLIGLINRLCEQGYELQNGQMDSFVKSEIESEIAVANAQRQIAQNPAAEPVVTILWSESPHLKDGQQMPLHEAEAVFKELDSARRHEREQPGYTGHWYDKTKFRIDFTMQGQPDSYEGRQDFGDGDGSLIQHIRGYHEYYAQDESWKSYKSRQDQQAREKSSGCKNDLSHWQSVVRC